MRILALSCAVFLAPAIAAAAPPPRVADFAWLAGGWIQEKDGETVREVWLAPREEFMAGVDVTTSPSAKPSFEFMTLSVEPAGVTFTATLAGQPPTPFVLKPGGGEEAVFENMAHDFPQRVIYRRCGADLCARIEGTEGGRLRSYSWRYRRAAP